MKDDNNQPTAEFEYRASLHTMIGNLTHWRENMKNNSNRMKIIVGRGKILNLLERFKVREQK